VGDACVSEVVEALKVRQHLPSSLDAEGLPDIQEHPVDAGLVVKGVVEAASKQADGGDAVAVDEGLLEVAGHLVVVPTSGPPNIEVGLEPGPLLRRHGGGGGLELAE